MSEAGENALCGKSLRAPHAIAHKCKRPRVEARRRRGVFLIEEGGHRSTDFVVSNERPAHHDRPARAVRIGAPQLKGRAEVVAHHSPHAERFDVLAHVLAQHDAGAQVTLLLKHHVAFRKAESYSLGRRRLSVDRTRSDDPLAGKRSFGLSRHLDGFADRGRYYTAGNCAERQESYRNTHRLPLRY